MHGDYSRGHEPDGKRGRSYRRVLLQQGRPVLDSDVAASVDALLGEVRAATRGLSCAAGSPDLGFLVTPGRLLGILAESGDRLKVAAGAPDVWVDYRFRYGGRFPALAIAAGAGAASVTVPLLTPADPGVSNRAGLWARVETATTIDLNGIGIPLAPESPDVPHRVEFSTGGAVLDPLQITVQPGAEVWLFVLEQDEAADGDPVFWIAPGSYHVDGLVVDARGGGPFPSSPFPEADGFPWAESPRPDPPLGGLLAPEDLQPDDHLVAYLEVFERHITHVEDPGIREEALGTGDTTTRTQLLGQVKLASIVSDTPTAAALRSAFSRVEVSGGELTIDVPEATPVTDPCALPDPAGYRGTDNRLYRLEVHDGGGLAQMRLKWSRDNGSELFAARLDESDQLVFDAGTPLAAGDIVELLSSVVDLGDDALAQVSAGGFVPAPRAVGQLAQLVAGVSSGLTDDVAFTLVDLADGFTPVVRDARYGTLPDAVLKLRRWHGTLAPQGAAGPHVLEDGVTVTLSETGAYRAGQYWQYEARVRRENANGPWRGAPHGPERRFAPLALLAYRGAGEQLALVAWLDERFSHPCDLDADDVDFDGGRVGTESDTVQEALEELYDRLPPIEQWPTVAAGGINWRNDRTLPIARFNEGLQVTFSEEMHPASATSDTFVVALEVPDDDGVPGLRRSLIVDGRVDVAGSTWTFVPRDVDAATVGRWVRDLGGPVRCRIRLAAAVILDRAGERPLDGDAVGLIQEDGYNAFVDLRLPSGDGRGGGDFESWFYLTGPPPLVAIEHVNPADGVRFAAGTGPRTILMSFTDHVRFSSVNGETLTVAVHHSSEADDGDGRPIPGTIQPYPFETEPGVVSRVTFAPEDPEALRPSEAPAAGAWIFTVRARGTGDRPIVDLDDRALDGAGIDKASDFVSRFFVESAPR